MKIDQLLAEIPGGLRAQLLCEYENLSRHYAVNDYRSAGLDAGRFCEVVYAVLDGYVNDGKYGKVTKPQNMVSACQKIENASKELARSMRLIIPRMLLVLYEIRNNRDVGHVSEEVDSSYMDAVFVMYSASWIMAELIRIYGSIDVDEAQKIVDSLVRIRTIPLVWEVDDRKIVMSINLSMIEQVLVILYQSYMKRTAKNLLDDISPGDRSHFKTRVILRGQEEKLWFYNAENDVVELSPLGAERAEEIILGQY